MPDPSSTFDFTESGGNPPRYPVSRVLAQRILLYLGLFRMAIAFLLVLGVFGDQFGNRVQIHHEAFAQALAFVYLVLALSFLLLWSRYKSNPFLLADKVVVTDLIICTLIMHTMGGLPSGMGILLVFYACVGAVLLPRGLAIGIAAATSTAVVGETAYGLLEEMDSSRSLTQAGMYGLMIIFGALICGALARWSREFELLASQKITDFKNLEQINELVIQRLRSGVLVLDNRLRVQMMNQSAWYLLGSPDNRTRSLPELSARLAETVKAWRETRVDGDEPITISVTQAKVIPRCLDLPGDPAPGTMVFLEDTDLVSRRANALSINALAKLSGSIAHEIRNPLAAVNHAAQLLRESEGIGEEDAQLLDMIVNHGHRMNDIVENILQLSRREASKPEVIDLGRWLGDLADEVRSSDLGQKIELILDPPAVPMTVLFDKSQLHQVMWKLLENAAIHAGDGTRRPVVNLRPHSVKNASQCVLEISDDGVGIPERVLDEVFEPFFTTSKQGSGLGLYIAKQICDANLSEMTVDSRPGEGTRFRIRLRQSGVSADFGQQETPQNSAASSSRMELLG